MGLSSALNELQAGDLYIQVHTLNFSSGELRGQIVPVPEPAMLELFLAGSSCFFLRRRR
ncbi:MAG: hypothetical protein CMO80_17515 [Verrucomicrobiales bacterium]|nr:hypothetical protein [Verrucomicrobiales bacterium]